MQVAVILLDVIRAAGPRFPRIRRGIESYKLAREQSSANRHFAELRKL